MTEAQTQETDKAKIYIGHEKEDYEGRRTGKPGRFIEDDPSRYPAKEDVGFMSGATGGWAGGEAGLKKFIAEVRPSIMTSLLSQLNAPQYQETAAAPKAASKPKIDAKETVPTVTGKKAPVTKVEGKDLIYVGYGKECV